ncbi:MAG: two pore domain potassium channel family protein [Bacteroidetes bacterium]|nr:two pore domain potassium channel family protein [Bacteroidota bacterium]
MSFKNVDFKQSKITFHFAKFGEGDKSFENASFGNNGCDFRKVEFGSGKIDFRKAGFGNGDVFFDESEFISGKLIFRLATFGSGLKSFENIDFGTADALFENVNFGTGTVSFAQSKARNITFKGSHLNVYLDLKINECDSIDLTDTVIRDIVDLKPSTYPIKITKLYLVGTRNLGRIIVDWEMNNVKNLIKNQSDSTLKQKAEQFNIFKENFHLNGQYEDEDKAYVQFKRFEHRAEVINVKTKGGKEYLKAPFLFFRWLVFDKMGLFATSPLRVLFSMLLVYVCFSLLYLLVGFFNAGSIINAVGATDNLSFLQTCFYHSAITFLTIGYGDYYPMGFERGISIIEGWSGVFLMSYFTVAFVRKILR